MNISEFWIRNMTRILPSENYFIKKCSDKNALLPVKLPKSFASFVPTRIDSLCRGNWSLVVMQQISHTHRHACCVYAHALCVCVCVYVCVCVSVCVCVCERDGVCIPTCTNICVVSTAHGTINTRMDTHGTNAFMHTFIRCIDGHQMNLTDSY